MSACPKIDYEIQDMPAEQIMPAPPSRSPWWHGAIHVAALLSFLSLCGILSVVGLLWYSLLIEPR
jgi:hypothetical protein